MAPTSPCPDRSSDHKETAGPKSLWIGLDFGTQNSGFSVFDPITHTTSTITRWPGSYPGTTKVPSIIVLGQNAGADRWGFDVSEKEEDAHRLIKLALLHTDQLPAGIQDSSDFESELNLIRSQCRTASSVASALIRNIFFHSLSDVAERQRKTLESLLKEFTLHVVVGVPASWQQDARVRLLEVISDAGIPGTLPTSTLELFTEPEASALVFAGEFEEMFNLVDGDTIVICDLGGATVDVISYQWSLPPSAVRPCLMERVPGEATFGGAVLLDAAFLSLVKKKIARRAEESNIADTEAEALRRDAINLFEDSIKDVFDGGVETLPNIPASRGGRRRPQPLTFTKDEITAVFDAVAGSIVRLAHSHIDTTVAKTGKVPKGLILSGGFGGNPYVQKKLKEELDRWLARGYEKIDRYCPDTWNRLAAVSRGCAMEAFRRRGPSILSSKVVSVSSRMARASYWFPQEGPAKAFITKGESLSVESPKRIRMNFSHFESMSVLANTAGLGICIMSSTEDDKSKPRRFCEVEWTVCGRATIESIRQGALFELAAVYSGDMLTFDIYVGGNETPLSVGSDCEVVRRH